MDSSPSNNYPRSTKKSSFLKRLSISYNKKWKPLLAAKTDLDEEYNFVSGRRRGAEYMDATE
jgi:hypothetical protein